MGNGNSSENNKEMTLEKFLNEFQKDIIKVIRKLDEKNKKDIKNIKTKQTKISTQIINLEELIKEISNQQKGNGLKNVSKKNISKKNLIPTAEEYQIVFPQKYSNSRKLKEGMTYYIMCKIILNTEPNRLSKENYKTMCKMIGYSPNENMKKHQLIKLLKQKLN